VADDPLEIVRVCSSSTRLRILKLLQQGFDHPEDLAKKLKVRRQAVDKQITELFGWGLVDRSAVFPPTGRPRIVYQVTQRGKDLVDLLEKAAQDFRASFRGDYERELEDLDAKLAAGEVAQEMYFKKRGEIDARYKWVVGP
jgi:predicted ArsR family transcriptional regulator